MQKFTRALTREIELGGERLAVTLSAEGLAVRPVGSRRPPSTMSWAAWLCACAGPAEGAPEPTAEDVAQAVQRLKSGKSARPQAAAATTAPDAPAAPSAPAASNSAPAASAPDGRDKPSLPALLSRLENWLSKHRPRFVPALRPGASPAQFEALQSELGCPLPDELRTLLTWHNGQDEAVPGALEQNWVLLSTDQIAAAKKEMDADPADGWQPSWVPFLDDDAGNCLCLDTGRPGPPVIDCWLGRPQHDVVAPSLTAWMADFVAGLERGEYHEDPERGAFLRRS